jgi:hypothetical protein
VNTDTDAVVQALEKLVAPFPDSDGDWAAIVRRAEVTTLRPVADRVVDRRARLGRRMRLGLPALGAAAAAAVLVLLWPFSSSSSVLDNALAAIGTRPVTHVVLESELGSYLLDLQTGKRTATSGRQEIWYQPARGLLVRWTFRGVPAGTWFVPRSEIVPGTSRYVSQFVLDYRAKLRAHAFHVTGRGSVAGTPVYWLSSTPTYIGRDPTRKQVQQVAVSRATYKPVYFRLLYNNRIILGTAQRVLSIETINAAPPALGGHRPITEGVGWDLGYAQIPLTQAQAQRPRAIIPPAIAGLRLSWTGNSPFITGPNGVTLPGVCLYYGAVLKTGLPNDNQPSFKGRYIEIVEFPHENAMTRFYAGRFPGNGAALINALPAQGPVVDDIGAHTATLKTHDRYLLIQASSESLALATAKAVTR